MVHTACVLSALCFIVSGILGIILIVKDTTRITFDSNEWRTMSSQYLIQEWVYRNSVQTLSQVANIINAFAWLFFVIPVLQLTWSLSRGGQRKIGVHAAIIVFAVSACFTEVISRLLLTGATGAAHRIAQKFELNNWLSDDMGQKDYIGWKALEVSYIMITSLVTWIDAFEWISLFFILILIYFSVGTQMKENRVLPMWWARLGLFIAFMTFVDFSADILRLEDWPTFSQFAIFVAIFNQLLLFPTWILILSSYMNRLAPIYIEENDTLNAAEQVPMVPQRRRVDNDFDDI
eukprot:CAMPEP_0194136724 /NCGR_PEP_ID=MMETSP0152-20130528/6726_1 /TAXON_ID=1049557 /ORGANISM="Thalassiothrix antarctica, Strain L6-D1" /LENGTH=290 /DNA_ID=CAMNT_0038833497 /DNA_START=82 /DNA_END=954 /DNA_ORIENTATION=-